MSVWVLIFVAVIALIPAKLAQRKGQSAIAYWVFGVIIWPVALLVVLFEKDKRRRCDHCAEIIRKEARVCPHCQRDLAIAPAT